MPGRRSQSVTARSLVLLRNPDAIEASALDTGETCRDGDFGAVEKKRSDLASARLFQRVAYGGEELRGGEGFGQQVAVREELRRRVVAVAGDEEHAG